MDAEIDPTERRILGVLIEKQLATPDAYPLSVRDLHAGANQRTCRDPVTNYQEWEIEGALASLFDKKLTTYVDGARVRKYKHRVDERLGLSPTRLAVLAELLLRGAQQPGELRRNADRLARLPEDADLEAVLADLAARTPPLVLKLPRQPRERDVRWTQTLAPDAPGHASSAPAQSIPAAASLSPSVPTPSAPPPNAASASATRADVVGDAAAILARLDALEREVAALRARLDLGPV